MLEKYFNIQRTMFNYEFKNSLIFHIPHSSTYIPFMDGFNMDLLENEINLLTDWKTDEIFNVENVKRIVTPYSRIFCDVERFHDDIEPLYKKGRGFFYTHCDNGEILRDNDVDVKENVFQNYYIKHHNIFEQIIQDTLITNGFVTIIDCHSFSNTPYETDLDQSLDRPDICIGTDDFHTPKWLCESLLRGFSKFGLKCDVNTPYSGSIVPQKFYKKNNLVSSVMIEINKNLYIENGQTDMDKVWELNRMVSEIFNTQF